MSTSCTNSSALSISCFYYIPKPSYDPTNKNCIIISTNCYETQTTPGIYKYNMVTNESQIIYKYDGIFTPDRHGQFIDPSNNTLILYGGEYDIWQTFDLNTNTMKQINDKNMIRKCGCDPQNTFIRSPTNQIHVMDYQSNHYKFDITNNEIVQIKTNKELKSHNIHYPKLLYIELHKKIFVF
eukprot:427224_1